jgi:hypothetical protein
MTDLSLFISLAFEDSCGAIGDWVEDIPRRMEIEGGLSNDCGDYIDVMWI